MLSFNTRGYRAAVQNLRPPQRWLSFTAHSNRHWTASGPRSSDKDRNERKRPSIRSNDGSNARFREKRGQDRSGGGDRFSSPRAGPPQTGRGSLSPRAPSSRTLPSRGPPQRAPPPRALGLALIPKLPQEEEDKISTAQDIWEARSLYFTPPKRPPKPKTPPKKQQPPPPPPRQPRRGSRHEVAVPSASSIRAAILNLPEDQAPPPPPTPEPEVLTGIDGGALSVSPARDVQHAQVASFFLSPPAKFLYSAFSFKQHPVNTTTPEICVVGASNCGKSSFINALTAASSSTLAKVSERAGKTVSMNAYGVGPLSHSLPVRKILSPRAANERPPGHGLVLVDTPGYGHASREHWGREIVEYVQKRTMLRGVVLLLSAEKKVSKQDEQIVKLLANAERPVMVVFTKMDKVLRQKRRSEEGGVTERLREVERCLEATGWRGWTPRIYLTAARMERDKTWKADPTRSAAGMAGVRMAVLELAGLREFVAPEKPKAAAKAPETVAAKEEKGEKATVEVKRQEPGKALESDPAAWSGDVISFEELEKKFGDWSS